MNYLKYLLSPQTKLVEPDTTKPWFENCMEPVNLMLADGDLKDMKTLTYFYNSAIREMFEAREKEEQCLNAGHIQEAIEMALKAEIASRYAISIDSKRHFIISQYRRSTAYTYRHVHEPQ